MIGGVEVMTSVLFDACVALPPLEAKERETVEVKEMSSDVGDMLPALADVCLVLPPMEGNEWKQVEVKEMSGDTDKQW
eukprot:1329378-Ditylum_brightwellii.AAC.1